MVRASAGGTGPAEMTRIGVLALQGAFREHLETLASIGVEGVPVRLPEDLQGLDGLIIPGGESTTMRKLIDRWGLRATAAKGPAHDPCIDRYAQGRQRADPRAARQYEPLIVRIVEVDRAIARLGKQCQRVAHGALECGIEAARRE